MKVLHPEEYENPGQMAIAGIDSKKHEKGNACCTQMGSKGMMEGASCTPLQGPVKKSVRPQVDLGVCTLGLRGVGLFGDGMGLPGFQRIQDSNGKASISFGLMCR